MEPSPQDNQGETDASQHDGARFGDRVYRDEVLVQVERDEVLVKVAVVLGFVEVSTVSVVGVVALEG